MSFDKLDLLPLTAQKKKQLCKLCKGFHNNMRLQLPEPSVHGTKTELKLESLTPYTHQAESKCLETKLSHQLSLHHRT